MACFPSQHIQIAAKSFSHSQPPSRWNTCFRCTFIKQRTDGYDAHIQSLRFFFNLIEFFPTAYYEWPYKLSIIVESVASQSDVGKAVVYAKQ